VVGSSASVGSEIITILPASLPRYLSKSATRLIGASTTSPEIVPFVPGVQATGMARSSSGRGVTMRASERTIDQPRPNSKPSARTLDRPWSRNHCWAQRSVSRICGELVMRPPMRSVRWAAVRITSEWLKPWSKMPLTAARSGAWAMAGAAARTAATETAASRRFM
jgi:hypothetical protein